VQGKELDDGSDERKEHQRGGEPARLRFAYALPEQQQHDGAKGRQRGNDPRQVKEVPRVH
jgi:hypothetical protein